MPPKGLRKKASGVTDTKGNDFEDYGLKRVLLMGIFEKDREKLSDVSSSEYFYSIFGRKLANFRPKFGPKFGRKMAIFSAEMWTIWPSYWSLG